MGKVGVINVPPMQFLGGWSREGIGGGLADEGSQKLSFAISERHDLIPRVGLSISVCVLYLFIGEVTLSGSVGCSAAFGSTPIPGLATLGSSANETTLRPLRSFCCLMSL
jgi:hypothetical protein